MVLSSLSMVSESIYIAPYHTATQKVKGCNFISVAFYLVWDMAEKQTGCNVRKSKVKTAERSLLPLHKWMDLQQNMSLWVTTRTRFWGVLLKTTNSENITRLVNCSERCNFTIWSFLTLKNKEKKKVTKMTTWEKQ